MNCPKCKSDNIQRYQVIHEQGTSNISINSKTGGAGLGFGGGLRGGLGLASTGSSGTSQTLLAKKTQPPKDTRLVPIIPILIIGLLFYNPPYYYFYFYCVITLLLFIFYFIKAGNLHEENYNEWLNKWYCNKCGDTFIKK